MLKALRQNMTNNDTLKQHGSVSYRIKGKDVLIADLTDNQLEMGKFFLKNKFERSAKQEKQLESINYILNYKAELSKNRLIQECYNASKGKIYNKPSLDMANKQADVIMNWLGNIGFIPKVQKSVMN